MGCIITYLSKGFIPIIDVGSFGNVFNSFSPSHNDNPRKVIFNRPFNYTLAEETKIIDLEAKRTPGRKKSKIYYIIMG